MTSCCFLWHLVLRSFTKPFTREFRAWKAVSGQPKLWPLLGFSILINVDFEDVRLLLVSPLAEGDLTEMLPDELRNKDRIVTTFVSAFTLRHNNCPSNLIDPGHCPWLEEFAWLRHNSRWPSRSTSLVIIYHIDSYSFHSRVTSYDLKGIVIWLTSALPKCPRWSRLLPSHKGSNVVGRRQNWMSRRAVSRVIFSRLHAQFTRFLSISFIFRRCLRICTLKMFTRRPPYEEDSSSEDRSKPPMRTGLLKPKVWNDLWDILVVCWSPDPLYRPTASELEANLRKILQPNSKWIMIAPSLFFIYLSSIILVIRFFPLST